MARALARALFAFSIFYSLVMCTTSSVRLSHSLLLFMLSSTAWLVFELWVLMMWRARFLRADGLCYWLC